MVKDNLKYNDQSNALNGSTSPDISQVKADNMSDATGTSGEPVRVIKKPLKSRKAVQEFLGGDYLSREWVTGNLSYILYLALLAMIYIGNTYYTEKKYKNIEVTKNGLKELRYQYITTKSILMFQCRQSEIAKRALILGLKGTTMPPYKILYSGETLKSKKE